MTVRNEYEWMQKEAVAAFEGLFNKCGIEWQDD
jgi:hypothetical protein